MRPTERQRFPARHRSTEQVALPFVPAMRNQRGTLIRRFDSFSRIV